MASSFGQYQSGIAPVTGISEAGARIGATYLQGATNLTNSLSEGIQKYSQGMQENEAADARIQSIAGQIKGYHDMFASNPEYQKFADSFNPIIDTLSTANTKSLSARKALIYDAENQMKNIGDSFKIFNVIKTDQDNKQIATVGLNEAQNQLTTLAGQLKDDKNNQDLYKSVQERLAQLNDVRTKPTVAQGAFLTGTSEFLKSLPTTLAISDKLRTGVGMQRVGEALNEVNSNPPVKLSPVQIEGLSTAYDATKTAYDNNLAIDNILNQFRQTHNIPVSNQKIVAQVFSNIRDKAKATKTPQGMALAESLDTYIQNLPQNLKEEGVVPAGSSYTTTDMGVLANVAVPREESKKFSESLAMPSVSVNETKEVPLTDDERKAAVLAKVSKQYGVAPAEFNQWYNSLVPVKPSASIQQIGGATVGVTTNAKGEVKFTNITQPKPQDAFKTEKEKQEYNATTSGKLNPKTGIKEHEDAQGNPIWEDVGKDADIQLSGRMQNVNDEQVKLFRNQKVAYSELMTQIKDLIELKNNYSVLASKGQAPEDSEMEKRIKTEMGIMKSRLQRVLYPTGQPRAWEDKNITEIMPELTVLFTYNTTQLGGLDQLKIRLKNAIEEDAKGYNLLVRDKPKEEIPKTPEQLAEIARQVAIENQVKGQIRK